MIPTRKVAAGGLAGALTTIVMAVLSRGWGVELTGDEAAAIVTLLSFATAYMVPEKPENRENVEPRA